MTWGYLAVMASLARHVMWCPYEGGPGCLGPSAGDIAIGAAVADGAASESGGR